ncbi:integrin, beta 1b precursor [Silurus asotus]|uniref:Integrin, beta 1b n=1 Tax=Silurus asotus TaxID=30991 RepID=A0AAD5FCZ3_SILAS|nr:integrin, beta 1b precursor [Silurus asotus]
MPHLSWSLHRAQCRAFKNGEISEEKCSQKCSHFKLIMVKEKEDLPQPNSQPYLSHCKERDANDCWFFFTYATKNESAEVYVVEKLGKWNRI